jgi:23S rRNA pseudouridine2457 synthase
MELYRYLAFFKPFGIPSTFTDESGRMTLKEYVQVKGVYAAGRLDLASEGLLILTNDGGLIHRLTDPVHHLFKTYFVQVEGLITPDAIASLESGLVLDDVMTRRCKVMLMPEPSLPPRGKPITPHGPTCWIRVDLREGKKHQIRRMTAAVGFPTLRLVRYAIGPITLGELQPGQSRDLSLQEIKMLKEKVGH